MRTSVKLLAAALLAAIALGALGAGTASALRRLELQGGPTLTLTAREVRFSAGELGSITCDITYVKTVENSIIKTTGVVYGRMREVLIANGGRRCAGAGGIVSAEVRVLGLERPEKWNIAYLAILGTLPSITGVLSTLRGIQMLFESRTTLGVIADCLYEGEVGLLAPVTSGTVGDLRTLAAETQTIRITRDALNNAGCPVNLSVTATLRPSQTIRLRLM